MKDLITFSIGWFLCILFNFIVNYDALMDTILFRDDSTSFSITFYIITALSLNILIIGIIK